MTTEKELLNLQWACAKKYLDRDKAVNWEQRRYEIAKEMLPALHKEFAGSVNWQCETAVKYADQLISQLKKDS